MISSQANVEYWFRLLYECVRGSCYNVNVGVPAILSSLWFWTIIVGYLLSILAFIVIIYCLMQLYELRKREEEFYSTLIAAPQGREENRRWQHIQSLIESGRPSEWREAITEADILLDDVLGRAGYMGAGVGEKLKSATRADFHTLDDAWEAHKIRNQIAHEGSTFDLSETLAHRTVARFEAVFREFGAI